MLTRPLWWLTLLTIAALIACWFMLKVKDQQGIIPHQTGKLIFPKFHQQIKEITEIQVVSTKQQFTLQFKDNHWQNTAIGHYPAINARIQQLLNTIATLSYLEAKTQRKHLHHKLGVQQLSSSHLDTKNTVTTNAKDSTRINFKNQAGNILADIFIGDSGKNINGLNPNSTYIRLPNDNQVWLAKGVFNVANDAISWSNHQVTDIHADSLQAISIKHKNGEVIDLHRKYSQSPKLSVKNLPSGYTIEHQYQIDYIATLWQNMQFINTRRTTDKDKKSIPDFEVATLTSDQIIIRLLAYKSKADGSVWVQIDAEFSHDAQPTNQAQQQIDQIKSRFAGWSIQLPRTVTDRLSIQLDDIIQKTITNQRLSP